jgi:hypothetical protein
MKKLNSIALLPIIVIGILITNSNAGKDYTNSPNQDDLRNESCLPRQTCGHIKE